ncbi:trem-like transcript 4 protein [Rattus rattus]|uniref:trem-like transcript 4 protein n=1 Tax=Rattus rattus TaxID=10117 RepID=UPI0013F3706D|nr:trem-like transcript 4 protein [Rattus rattus]
MAWEATYLLSSVLLLLLASGSWAQDPEVLRTWEGKTVSVKCEYNPRYRFNVKTWCKEVSEVACPPLVSSVSRGAEKLRFSIQEDSQFSFFNVTMTELKTADSGIYHCGFFGNYRNVINILKTIRLVVSKAPHTTTRMTTALASTHSPVIDSSPDKPMWKVIIAGVLVATLLVLGLVILVVLYLKKPREKAQNVGNKCHHIYEDFSGQKEETTNFNQQVLSSEDTENICYASLIHLNHVSPQGSQYRNTQPSGDPILSVEYASISRNGLGSSKSNAQEVETRD